MSLQAQVPCALRLVETFLYKTIHGAFRNNRITNFLIRRR